MSITPGITFTPASAARGPALPGISTTTLVDHPHVCVRQLTVAPLVTGDLRLAEAPGTVAIAIVHDADLHPDDRHAARVVRLTPGCTRRLTVMGMRRAATGDALDGLPATMMVPATPDMLLQIESLRGDTTRPPRSLWAAAQAMVLLALAADAMTGHAGARLPEHLATAILDQRLSCPPSVTELAALCSTSRATLARRFRTAFGMTVREYLRSKRLEAARALLAREGMSVTEAALAVGYDSLPSFSRAFHAHFGQPPVAVRNASRSPAERSRSM